MIGVFTAQDLLLFYIFFEGGLIPMYLIIGIWGGVERIKASYKFFLYTLAGSVLMLIAMLVMIGKTGTTSIPVLMNTDFDPSLQWWLWLAFFASFAVKMPMWPVHTWLPDAHVQAPTAGSVILAGVLLKMGGYGFIRFSLPMFPQASANAEVRQSDLVGNIAELPTRFMSGMGCWEPIMSSTSPQIVIDAYQRWMPIEILARNYIRHIASAMKLYIEHHHPSATIESGQPEENFVYIYQSWVTKAPYLSHHIGIAALLAQFMVMMKPGMERTLLAVTVAHAKTVSGDIFKSEELVKMRDNVLRSSDSLPAICSPWPGEAAA